MRKTRIAFLLLFIITPIWADVITQNIQNGCDVQYIGVYKAKLYARWQPNTYTCAVGYFLPANAIECVRCSPDHTCPGGTFTFNENISQGITFNTTLTTDFAGGCVNDYLIGKPVKTYTKWTINSYNCDSGYYLPADGIECELCPENTVCSGGTYSYSENTIQGITGCVTGYNLNNNVCIANSIDITWNSGNDSESTTTQCTYDGDITLPTPPEKVGYTFIGWKLIADDSSD